MTSPLEPSPAATRATSEPATRRTDLIVAALIGLAATGVLFVFHYSLTKPLWVDEQWRAYHTTRPTGFFNAAVGANGPMAAGWLFIERALGSIRNTQVLLRIPSFVSYVGVGVAMYTLGRRWMGARSSALMALTLVMVGSMITYGTQMKAYVVEGFVTVLMLLLWDSIHRRERSIATVTALYVGIGVGMLVSLPGILVAAPLLAFDALRIVRRKDPWIHLVPIVAVAILALSHAVFFVGTSASISSSDYWESAFAPHNLSALPGFIFRGVVTFPTEILRGALKLPRGYSGMLDLFGTIVVIVGAVRLWRSERGRGIVVGFASTLLLLLVLSFSRRWLFGPVRVNLFIVPVFWFLGAVGLATTLRWATDDRARALAGALAFGFVLIVIGTSAVSGYAQIDHQSGLGYGAELERVVGTVRRNSAPTDLAVAVHPQTRRGWLYYMNAADALEGLPMLTPERTLFVDTLAQVDLVGFARANPEAQRLWLLVWRGSNASDLANQTVRLRDEGFCAATTTSYEVTGILVRFERLC